MKYEEREVFKEAIVEFGPEPQLFMLFEEMGELMQAISKNHRGRDNLDNVAEEITDLQIMLDEAKVLFNVELACDVLRVKKIENLIVLIKEHREALNA